MSDTEKFEEFMASYQDMVYSVALRLLANPADAEDIAQEVFIKAYAKFPEFEGITNLGGWLRRITINLSLNHLNRYRTRLSFFSELSDEESNFEYVQTIAENETANQVEDNERLALIDKILQSLPPAQRVPIILYHFEGMSYEEIARQLGVSLSKVKIDIHRGRQALRRILENSTDAGRDFKIKVPKQKSDENFSTDIFYEQRANI